MKGHVRSLLVATVAVISLACSTGASQDGDGDGGPGHGDGDGGDGDGLGDSWTSLHECRSSDPQDSISIDGARIEGSDLLVDVGHSAGCATHTYGLCYAPEWDESEPVQVRLTVLHDDGGEMCEAHEMKTLRFDLTPIEEKYEEYYLTDEGQIRLGIGDTSVVYTFGSVPTWEQIDGRIEAINSCEVVEDCAPISVRACETRYVNSDADTTRLEADIQKRLEADYGTDLIACDASCECGVLTCAEGRCVTAAGNCEEPVDGVMVCL